MMKKKSIIYTFLSAMVAITGCSDDQFEEMYQPWEEGDNIEIGARAGYENSDNKESRTEYSGSFTEGNIIYERVNWVTNDKIGIFCQEARNPYNSSHYAEYLYESRASQTVKEDYGIFKPVANSSLQWGNQTTHTFYGVYPAQSVSGNSTVDANGNISGNIPSDQSFTQVDFSNNTYVVKPDMNYAYMTAKAQVTPGSGTSVNLSFQPIVTALEIEIKASQNYTEHITGIYLHHETENLAGGFISHLGQNKVGGYYPCEWDKTTASNNINISFTHASEYPNGIKLTENQSIKFTVFMLPIHDLKDLSLTVQFESGVATRKLAKKTGEGTYDDITYKAHRKHIIKNLLLPKKYEGNNWISRIDDNVLLGELSIPGTGNSYSSNAPASIKTQTLSITNQWNLGIRCFDVIAGNTNTTDFGQTPICTAKENIIADQNITSVFTSLNQLILANPNEFVVVTILYQPSGDIRNASEFLTSAKTYFENPRWNDRLRVFDPNAIVKERRGKIMVILRPTSLEEDKTLTFTGNENINNVLIVDGWGSLQDKWKQRGYNVKHNALRGILFNAYKEGTMEADIFNTYGGGIYLGNSKTYRFKRDITRINYEYRISNGGISYIQEWPRVVEKTMDTSIAMFKASWYHWEESYSQKKHDIVLTLGKSMRRENIKNVRPVYINSLCGYFIDGNARCDRRDDIGGLLPIWGTTTGNFKKFASSVNEYTFTEMQRKQINHESGPMGIIMMNFVGDPNTPSSYLMPAAVVRNNFTFPLQKRQ